MVELIFNTGCIIGLVLILKYGSILDKPRNFLTKWKFFKQLFDCGLCLGFWCGVFFGLFWGNPFSWCWYGAAAGLFGDLTMNLLKKKIWG